MDNKIQDFNKKYHKIENTLDIGILIQNNIQIFFYIKYKLIYRMYWCFQFLGIIVSFKVVNNINRIEYFYDYIHKTNKRFNLK